MEKLAIQEIIPLTIQGEGQNTGMPCSFIRLFGCPVKCYFCDTGYNDNTAKYNKLPISKIIDSVKSQNVIITGGEPLVNPMFEYLVRTLQECNKNIFIETSGIKNHLVLDNPSIWITLSPKEHCSPTGKLDEQIIKNVSELKLIISSIKDFEYYIDLIKLFKSKHIPIYLQPEYSCIKNSNIIELIIDLINKFELKMSNQVHKLIGVN